MSVIDPKNASRLRDPETNPCLKESDLTTKCLEENNYTKEKCDVAFKNYMNCSTFWRDIMRRRRGAGIKPNMPGVSERERIKTERANGKLVISVPLQR